jgi:hypothetical protein
MRIKHSPMHSLDEPRLYGVLSNRVEFDQVWEEIRPMLLKTLEYSDGKYLPEDIYQSIKNNDMQLWVVYDKTGLLSFCITQILNYPQKKILSLPFVGGKEMFRWLNLTEIIKEFAREKKCDFAEGYARDGWLKVLKPLGFEKSYSIIKCDL